MHKVLLVEDDANMITLLKTYLELEGFQVIAPIANNREQIVALAKKEAPNLLLLDVHLNRQNGLDVLQDIRQAGNGRHPYVIMMSGSDLREECLHAGADAFMMKPYMPSDLVVLMRSLLTAG
jgi:DNA-binding response OmpR family regulator